MAELRAGRYSLILRGPFSGVSLRWNKRNNSFQLVSFIYSCVSHWFFEPILSVQPPFCGVDMRLRTGIGRLASSRSVAQDFNNKAVGGVNGYRDERFVTNSGKAVRRVRSNYYYVASTSDDLQPIDNHCRLAGEHDAGFGIRMLMKSRSSPWLKVAMEERDACPVWEAFELDSGDCAFLLIATIHDVEHSSSS